MKRLTDQFHLLTEAEQGVCKYIIYNFEDVSNMSLNDLTDKVHTSKTVVINVAQKLGFEGYTDLRYYLKDQMKFKNTVADVKDLSDAIVRLAKMTGNFVSERELQASAIAINQAETVYVAARGTSKSCAMHLNHLLLSMGIKCIMMVDYNLMEAVTSQLKPDEVIVYISLSGETRKIVDSANIAKARGATIIALTSFTNNRLSRVSDLGLYTASDSVDTAVDDSISRIGFFTIIEMLIHEIKIIKQLT